MTWAQRYLIDLMVHGSINRTTFVYMWARELERAAAYRV